MVLVIFTGHNIVAGGRATGRAFDRHKRKGPDSAFNGLRRSIVQRFHHFFRCEAPPF